MPARSQSSFSACRKMSRVRALMLVAVAASAAVSLFAVAQVTSAAKRPRAVVEEVPPLNSGGRGAGADQGRASAPADERDNAPPPQRRPSPPPAGVAGADSSADGNEDGDSWLGRAARTIGLGTGTAQQKQPQQPATAVRPLAGGAQYTAPAGSSAFPSDEAGMASQSWPLLPQLVSLLRTGHADRAVVPYPRSGDDDVKQALATTLDAVFDDGSDGDDEDGGGSGKAAPASGGSFDPTSSRPLDVFRAQRAAAAAAGGGGSSSKQAPHAAAAAAGATSGKSRGRAGGVSTSATSPFDEGLYSGGRRGRDNAAPLPPLEQGVVVTGSMDPLANGLGASSYGPSYTVPRVPFLPLADVASAVMGDAAALALADALQAEVAFAQALTRYDLMMDTGIYSVCDVTEAAAQAQRQQSAVGGNKAAPPAAAPPAQPAAALAAPGAAQANRAAGAAGAKMAAAAGVGAQRGAAAAAAASSVPPSPAPPVASAAGGSGSAADEDEEAEDGAGGVRGLPLPADRMLVRFHTRRRLAENTQRYGCGPSAAEVVAAATAGGDAAADAAPPVLPPPFLTLDAELRLGLGSVLVLEGGDGSLPLLVAQRLPNNTVLSVSWGSGITRRRAQAEGAAADGGQATDSFAAPADIHVAVKRHTGTWNSWVAEVPVPMDAAMSVAAGPVGSSAPAVASVAVDAVTAYLATRLSSDRYSRWYDAMPPNGTAAGIPSASALSSSSAGMSVGLLVLPQLCSLRGDALPHEFEARLGRLLALSRFAVLPRAMFAADGKDVPTTEGCVAGDAGRYFAYWSSVEEAVAAAVRRAGLVATIRPLTSLSAGASAPPPPVVTGGWAAAAGVGKGSNSGGNSEYVLVVMQQQDEAAAEDDVAAEAADEVDAAVAATASSGGSKKPPSTAAAGATACSSGGGGAAPASSTRAASSIACAQPSTLSSLAMLALTDGRAVRRVRKAAADFVSGSKAPAASSASSPPPPQASSAAAVAYASLLTSMARLAESTVRSTPVVAPEIASAVGVPLDVALALGLTEADAVEVGRQMVLSETLLPLDGAAQLAPDASRLYLVGGRVVVSAPVVSVPTGPADNEDAGLVAASGAASLRDRLPPATSKAGRGQAAPNRVPASGGATTGKAASAGAPRAAAPGASAASAAKQARQPLPSPSAAARVVPAAALKAADEVAAVGEVGASGDEEEEVEEEGGVDQTTDGQGEEGEGEEGDEAPAVAEPAATGSAGRSGGLFGRRLLSAADSIDEDEPAGDSSLPRVLGRRQLATAGSTLFSKGVRGGTAAGGSDVAVGSSVGAAPPFTPWSTLRPLLLAPSRRSKVAAASMSSEARALASARQAAVVAAESTSFNAWWSLLKGALASAVSPASDGAGAPGVVLVTGGENILLSTKIARSVPDATTVVAVHAPGKAHHAGVTAEAGERLLGKASASGVAKSSSWAPATGGWSHGRYARSCPAASAHADLLSTLGLSNTIVATSALTTQRMKALLMVGGDLVGDIDGAAETAVPAPPTDMAVHTTADVLASGLLADALAVLTKRTRFVAPELAAHGTASTGGDGSDADQSIDARAAGETAALIADAWADRLGTMTRLSRTAFIRMPAVHRLLHALEVLSPPALLPATLASVASQQAAASDDANQDADQSAAPPSAPLLVPAALLGASGSALEHDTGRGAPVWLLTDVRSRQQEQEEQAALHSGPGSAGTGSRYARHTADASAAARAIAARAWPLQFYAGLTRSLGGGRVHPLLALAAPPHASDDGGGDDDATASSNLSRLAWFVTASTPTADVEQPPAGGASTGRQASMFARRNRGVSGAAGDSSNAHDEWADPEASEDASIDGGVDAWLVDPFASGFDPNVQAAMAAAVPVPTPSIAASAPKGSALFGKPTAASPSPVPPAAASTVRRRAGAPVDRAALHAALMPSDTSISLPSGHRLPPVNAFARAVARALQRSLAQMTPSSSVVDASELKQAGLLQAPTGAHGRRASDGFAALVGLVHRALKAAQLPEGADIAASLKAVQLSSNGRSRGSAAGLSAQPGDEWMVVLHVRSTSKSSALPLPGPSLHALLVLGVDGATRARLARMHLSLPLPAIVRSALVDGGYAVGGVTAEQSATGAASAGDRATELSLPPWSMHVVRDSHPDCTARLLVGVHPTRRRLQGTGNGPRSNAAAASSSVASGAYPHLFRSRVCFNAASDDTDGDARPLPVDTRAADAVHYRAHSARFERMHGTAAAAAMNRALQRLLKAQAKAHQPAVATGATAVASDDPADLAEAWSALASQLTPLDTATGGAAGKFSFVHHGSGIGSLSLLVARAFPAATVLSIEADEAAAQAHLAAALRGGVNNNLIAQRTVDETLATQVYESPEFFRYQLLGVDVIASLLGKLASGNGNDDRAVDGIAAMVGAFASTAATTMVRLPTAASLSLLFTSLGEDAYPSPQGDMLVGTSLHDDDADAAATAASCLPLWYAAPDDGAADTAQLSQASFCAGSGNAGAHYAPYGGSLPLASVIGPRNGSNSRQQALLALARRYALASHPRAPFIAAESRLLSVLIKAPGSGGGGKRSDAVTKVAVAPVPALLQLSRATTDGDDALVDRIAPARAPLSTTSLADMMTAAAGDGAASGAWTAPLLPVVTSGLVRLDLLQLTRHVNHHFQSDIDGHTRKYTMHVQRNITAAAVLARALLQQAGGGGGSDALQQGAKWVDLQSNAAAAKTLASVYDRLAPGNHPNHGHTTLGDAARIIAAAEIVTAARARKEAAYAATGVAKPSGKIEFPQVDRDIGLALAGHYTPHTSDEAAGAAGGDGDGNNAADGDAEDDGQATALAAVSAAPAFGLLPGVTSIILTRDMDGAFIPYSTVHGITLITMLRLKLLPHLRARAYHQFVSLPLYLDMAPWNIVFVGSQLDYIDYDTKDRTYDKHVVKAYEVMEVLFNYKRTLEDFQKCGPKASNPYGFPFVSECVGGGNGFSGPCKDSAAPVPCGDGTCKPDYVSCLRSVSERDRGADGRKTLRWAYMEWAAAQAQAQAGGHTGKGKGLRGATKSAAAAALALPGGGASDAEAADGADRPSASAMTARFMDIPLRPDQVAGAADAAQAQAKKKQKKHAKAVAPAPLPVQGPGGANGGSFFAYDRTGVFDEEDGA